jgi:hypothetical protein
MEKLRQCNLGIDIAEPLVHNGHIGDFEMTATDKHECDNCGGIFTVEQLLPIDEMDWGQLLKRIQPGSIVPSGECPSCGALCYIEYIKDKRVGSSQALMVAAPEMYEALDNLVSFIDEHEDWWLSGTDVDSTEALFLNRARNVLSRVQAT